MSLLGTLQVGQSALAVQQAALQVTGNNIANAGNADYTRQVANLAPSPDQKLRPGMFIGTGVDLTGIKRQVDDALNARIRSSVADNQSADTTQQWLGRVEATFNELSDDDLSTQLSTFFNSWSDLANKPQDIGLRQIVIQNGDSLAGSIRDIRTQLDGVRSDMDKRLTTVAQDANSLVDQVAYLNEKIHTSHAGAG